MIRFLNNSKEQSGKHDAPFNVFFNLCQSFCGLKNSLSQDFAFADFLLTSFVKYYNSATAF